jgi:hypothetical protein
MRRSRLVIAIVAASSCAGEASDELFVSRLSSERTLSSLSGPERVTLCEDEARADVALAHQPDALDATCRTRGNLAASQASTTAERRAACQVEVDACRRELSAKTVDTSRCNDLPPRPCTATIEEYTECVNAELEFLVRAYDLAVPCDQLDIVPSDDEKVRRDALCTQIDSAFEAGCRRYHAKCPSPPP